MGRVKPVCVHVYFQLAYTKYTGTRELVCGHGLCVYTSVYLSESQDDIEPTLDSSSYGTWADWSVFYTSGSVPVIGVHTTYTDFSDLVIFVLIGIRTASFKPSPRSRGEIVYRIENPKIRFQM